MIRLICLLVIATSLSACGLEQVDEGYRGLRKVWGKVEGEPLTPGIYFYNPISSSISELSVREEIKEGDTTAFTKDTQSVSIKYAVTYFPNPDKIDDLYIQFGKDYADKLITPSILGSLKDSVGQFVADDLVSKREAAKHATENALKEALAARNITVTRLDFVNLDFADEYERAVEAKVVAVQKAQESKNITVRVKEEAEQKVFTAKADAESMKIKSQALSQNKSLIGYEWVQKWDGALPRIVLGNGSIPMIDMKDELK